MKKVTNYFFRNALSTSGISHFQMATNKTLQNLHVKQKLLKFSDWSDERVSYNLLFLKSQDNRQVILIIKHIRITTILLLNFTHKPTLL